MTFVVPYWTRRNGTLSVYIVLTSTRNIESAEDFAFRDSTYTSVKRLKLSKYRLNRTSKYVNLLESDSQQLEHTKSQPITHLLSKVNLLIMDSRANFPTDRIPEELFHDLM